MNSFLVPIFCLLSFPLLVNSITEEELNEIVLSGPLTVEVDIKLVNKKITVAEGLTYATTQEDGTTFTVPKAALLGTTFTDKVEIKWDQNGFFYTTGPLNTEKNFVVNNFRKEASSDTYKFEIQIKRSKLIKGPVFRDVTKEDLKCITANGITIRAQFILSWKKTLEFYIAETSDKLSDCLEIVRNSDCTQILGLRLQRKVFLFDQNSYRFFGTYEFPIILQVTNASCGSGVGKRSLVICYPKVICYYLRPDNPNALTLMKDNEYNLEGTRYKPNHYFRSQNPYSVKTVQVNGVSYGQVAVVYDEYQYGWEFSTSVAPSRVHGRMNYDFNLHGNEWIRINL